MKRLFSISLAALLLVCSLAGCGEKPLLDPDEPVTLTLWHIYGEQADAPMNRLVEEFNATVGQEKGILVKVTNVTNTYSIREELLGAMSGKPDVPDIPDLFTLHANIAVDVGLENLVDWNTCFSEEELADYVPEFIADGTIDGKLAVFPLSKSTYALFINGSQFDRFSADTGVTYEDLSTWEGFFDAAARYYEWSDGTPFCAFDYLIRHVEFDVMSKDGDLEYTEDGWYDFQDQSLKDSWLKFALPMVQGHIAVADLYASTHVAAGEALSGISSTAGIAYYGDTVTYPDNTSEPMDLKVLPLPKTGDGEQFMPMSGVGLCAYQTTEQKAEASAIFTRWLTEGERNLDFVVETGYMPVSNGAFAAIETYDFPDEVSASLFDAIRVMREEYTPVVRPAIGGYYDKTDTLYEWLRQTTPELRERSANGESAEDLAMETWDFFCSIQ